MININSKMEGWRIFFVQIYFNVLNSSNEYIDLKYYLPKLFTVVLFEMDQMIFPIHMVSLFVSKFSMVRYWLPRDRYQRQPPGNLAYYKRN